MHPSSPAHEIGRTKNGDFKDLTWRIQPQVGPLGKPGAKFRGLFLSSVLQTGQVAPRSPKHKTPARKLSVKR